MGFAFQTSVTTILFFVLVLQAQSLPISKNDGDPQTHEEIKHPGADSALNLLGDSDDDAEITRKLIEDEGEALFRLHHGDLDYGNDEETEDEETGEGEEYDLEDEEDNADDEDLKIFNGMEENGDDPEEIEDDDYDQ